MIFGIENLLLYLVLYGIMFAPKHKSVLEQRRILAILVTVELMTAFILFHPFQIFAQTLPSQKKFIPIPVRCSLNSLQPTNPIDMNTVIVGAMVKTIHVEKEVYACTGPAAIS